MEPHKGMCCKCKKMVEITNGKQEQTKNGRTIYKGTCGTCQTKVCRFIKKTD